MYEVIALTVVASVMTLIGVAAVGTVIVLTGVGIGLTRKHRLPTALHLFELWYESNCRYDRSSHFVMSPDDWVALRSAQVRGQPAIWDKPYTVMARCPNCQRVFMDLQISHPDENLCTECQVPLEPNAGNLFGVPVITIEGTRKPFVRRFA